MRREKIIRQKVEDDALSEPSIPSYQGHEHTPPQVIAQTPQPVGPGNHNSGDEDWHSVSSGRNVLHDAQILSLRCQRNGTSGRLIVTASDVSFEQRARKELLWSRTYQELVEMKKVRRSAWCFSNPPSDTDFLPS